MSIGETFHIDSGHNSNWACDSRTAAKATELGGRVMGACFFARLFLSLCPLYSANHGTFHSVYLSAGPFSSFCLTLIHTRSFCSVFPLCVSMLSSQGRQTTASLAPLLLHAAALRPRTVSKSIGSISYLTSAASFSPSSTGIAIPVLPSNVSPKIMRRPAHRAQAVSAREPWLEQSSVH